MSSIRKIKELLKFSKKKTYKIEMYAEAILDDARVIATDAEAFDIGAEVYVINDDGVVESLSEGIYTLQDGSKIRIDSESKVAGESEEVIEAEVVEEELGKEELEEVVEKEDVVEAVTADPVIEEVAVKINDATPDEVTEEISKEVAKIVVDHLATKVEEEVETTEVELSKDMIADLTTRIGDLENKLQEFEAQPSSDGLKVLPTNLSANGKSLFSKPSREDVLAMSTSERVQFMIQNKVTKI